ncbi:MAG: UDP-3-O-[3-hydroxymyristoyl] N-acetylglucosamine deacetylase, partial [Planctomycetes bacterium]|nr:UDP-3-O-[3-hydroxymyristoyl] N-acetylglucosamine deacetylase [Planctomycetota bacterium]
MHTARNQRTIAQAVSVTGIGYWSGRDVRVEFRPAAADTGVVFVRGDLPEPVHIPARVRHRIESPRRTTLSYGGASVEMVEHILAALAGLQIDNCEVWVDQPEMPGVDGSSGPFVAALLQAGAVVQAALRSRLVVRETTRLGDESCWIEAGPTSKDVLSVRFHIDYGRDNAIGRQTVQLDVTPTTFREQLADCRTFLLKAEADWLFSQGCGQRATYQDLLVFDEQGPIENRLRFPDECVRHKILDLVGDLALAGCDVIGTITAHCSGHRLNAQ